MPFALLVPAVPAAGAAPAFPVTVHAANGAVRITARPTAIVSLSPTATEMLYAIGAGSQVKAVDLDSDYPPGVPGTQLDGNSPNVEAIAADKPDLVVVSDEDGGLDAAAARARYPGRQRAAPPRTCPRSTRNSFSSVACTGHEAQARAEVGKIKRQIARIVASVHKPARPETYYYELDQTYYSAASSTFIGQVLALLGLRSIADAATGTAANGGYPQLSGEFILRANPDYILLADTVCCGQSVASVAARPGWSGLAAVKGGRVLGLNDDVASRWGPRVVDLLSEVAAELRAHPS